MGTKLPWQKDEKDDSYVLRVDLSTKQAIDRLKVIVENANYLISDLEKGRGHAKRDTTK